MTVFTMDNQDITIHIKNNALSTYQFGTHQAKHHFCKNCGIYTFHQSMLKSGQLRFNIDCIESIDSTKLPFKVYDGAAI
ncbi:MAG: hypothetical protein MJK11_16880 [Pseudomonadales bacterium]|nr:hypothetical protein [Pseudomonadales bacterium]